MDLTPIIWIGAILAGVVLLVFWSLLEGIHEQLRRMEDKIDGLAKPTEKGGSANP